MGSLDDLIRDLRRFEGRKEVTNALARKARGPVPAIRKAIRRRAVEWLPSSGGFGKWVSRLSVTAAVRLQGRAAGISLKGRRRGFADKQPKADLRRIDQGRAAHPSWGRRGEGQWHFQTVKPGFFTEPAAGTDEWRKAVVDAVDEALEVIRRG